MSDSVIYGNCKSSIFAVRNDTRAVRSCNLDRGISAPVIDYNDLVGPFRLLVQIRQYRSQKVGAIPGWYHDRNRHHSYHDTSVVQTVTLSDKFRDFALSAVTGVQS